MASVGIHPHEADVHPDVETETLVERAAHPRVIGIGETGLDYYYDRSDRERQRQSFRSHIAAARETQLPLIVHTRDAEEDTYEILADEMGKGAYPALIHCFTASQDFADKVLELGLYVSISGIVTFKNARELQEVAKTIPADRLLIETDSPFLAPVPHRGQALRARLRRRHGALPRRAARRERRGARRGHHAPISAPCSRRRRREGPHPGLRHVGGRAAGGGRLGRLRPDRAEEPPPPRLDPGRAWRCPHPGRHQPGPARAIARCAGEGRRGGGLDPRPCRSLPRHRRSAGSSITRAAGR